MISLIPTYTLTVEVLISDAWPPVDLKDNSYGLLINASSWLVVNTVASVVGLPNVDRHRLSAMVINVYLAN